MSIYVVTHKYLDNVPKLTDFYKWLYVGAYKVDNRRDGYFYDDNGYKNISKKNKNFCELTGLYWIRHNTSDNIKGAVHYRRYFTKNIWSENTKYFLSEEDIEEILTKYDCIVSDRKYFSGKNIAENYRYMHHGKDLDLLESIIRTVYPEYVNAFKVAMSKTYLFPYNMLIAKKEVFDEYVDWLLGIMLKLETEENLDAYDAYQSRVYGFLAERLLNVWLIKNKVSYIEKPTIQLGSRFRYNLRTELEKKLHHSLHFLAKLDDLYGNKIKQSKSK